MLDPRQLQVFLIAAETLNFSRTAERLHMSQPGVTQHIQLLEAQLGAPLFVRSGRRIALTPTGEALIPLARQVVDLSLRAEAVMGSLASEVHGHLMIGCSTTPGKYVLPVLLAEFMQRYPRVRATCQVVDRMTAFEMLEQGLVHFALSSSIDTIHQNIEFRSFISDPLVLIAPLNHPWAHRGEIAPDELRGARFILREETAGTYQVARAALVRLGINVAELQTILTLGNSEAIAIAVQQGVGVGFVSQMVYANMVYGKVAQVRVRGLTPCQEIHLCRHRLHPAGNVQAAFWDFAEQYRASTHEKVLEGLLPKETH